MNKKSFLSNVQMAEYILSRNRSTIKNQKSTPLSSVIFRSVDGVEHRIDISGAKTIYELSAVLKRADIDANVLLIIKRSTNEWEVTSSFKRMPNKWFITAGLDRKRITH